MDAFDGKQEDVWNYDGSALIKLDAWKDEDASETQVGMACTDSSVGERKAMKKRVNRFITEVDDLLMQVGNATFWSASKDSKDETIKTLASSWPKVVKYIAMVMKVKQYIQHWKE